MVLQQSLASEAIDQAIDLAIFSSNVAVPIRRWCMMFKVNVIPLEVKESKEVCRNL